MAEWTRAPRTDPNPSNTPLPPPVHPCTPARTLINQAMDRRRVKLRKSLDLCLNERMALEHVSSPFVVQLHHAFVTPTELVLVMDLMQGGDLKYHLHCHHPDGVPLPEAKYFVARTVLGLWHLHEHHYVYRDLKVSLGISGHYRRQTGPIHVTLTLTLTSPLPATAPTSARECVAGRVGPLAAVGPRSGGHLPRRQAPHRCVWNAGIQSP